MFDGVADQFPQFIASSVASATTLSFPPNFHHISSSNGFTSFDPFSLQQPQPQFLHQPHKNNYHDQEKEGNTNSLVAMNMEIETERSIADHIDNHQHHHHHHHHQQQSPWSNDEVLALLKIRSSMENWFPEFSNWEHVSRKLAELGFKRSADNCKEKFEQQQQSRYNDFNTISKSYTIFNELEQLCQGNENHHQHHQVVANQKNKSVEKIHKKDKKRTREIKKFEMFKGYCEDIVNKLMSQQEEMHKKLLQDMMKRDEEKVEREEAWKKQEMDRINQELELRAKQQAIAGDRQATIIKFLNKLQCLENQNPNPKSPTPTSTLTQNPNSVQDPKSDDKKYLLGKRWPRDEVMALINLRCVLSNSDEHEKLEGAIKMPLWERISQGMLELGYKRSAKRCKEKWENINKYFRKTKHVHKRRSLDSRTCPYFHKLSTLYDDGTSVMPVPGNHPALPENCPGATATNMQVQAPAFEF